MSKYKVHGIINGYPFAIIMYARDEEEVEFAFRLLHDNASFSYLETMPDDVESREE